jgi:hypothetical protein
MLTLDSPPPLSMVLPQLSHRERATNCPGKAPPADGTGKESPRDLQSELALQVIGITATSDQLWPKCGCHEGSGNRNKLKRTNPEHAHIMLRKV